MTQDEIIEMAIQAGIAEEIAAFNIPIIEAFAALVAAKALAQRTWVGLTDEEIDSYFEDHGWSPSKYYYPVIKDIESKLKELNT